VDCLLIGKVWPEPSSTAAGRRTQDVLRALLADSVGRATLLRKLPTGAVPATTTGSTWNVHFATAAQRGLHSLDLEAMGVQTHSVAVNDADFDQWIQSLAPDVVIFDRFMTEEQFGWRVAEQCPDALRVLDTSDLHCLRIAREQMLKTGAPLNLRNETALREIAAIYRSDLTLMISNFEMELLGREFAIPEDLLAYWPFAINLTEPKYNFNIREHFILIGSFLHLPNLDAARWCKQAIWPKIREALPTAELHCYGSYGDRYAAELNAPKDGVHFKGRAEDALDTMSRYRVNLAPIRYGAGLKGKVFDGFQTGTPTVMTPIAAEGICPNEGWSQAEAEAFASDAVRLYRSRQAWEARQSAERALCLDRFNAATWMPQLQYFMDQAQGIKEKRRQQNFVGQMLRHHSHRSTEFMSRWIEAKNK